jgi:hypothetical protein
MHKSEISKEFHAPGRVVTKKLLDTLFVYRGGKLYRKVYDSEVEITCVTRVGYIVVNIFGTVHYIHRLIWCMHTGETPTMTVNHIDQNKLNNTIENLREVTAAIQRRNMPLSSRNKTGVWCALGQV